MQPDGLQDHTAKPARFTSLSAAVRILIAGVALLANASGQEARMGWLSSGIGNLVPGYSPQRAVLHSSKPTALKKPPGDVTAPLYGELKFGPREAQTSRLLLLDEPTGKPPRLFVDSNGNGDLTDDAPATWTEQQVAAGGVPTVIRMGEATVKIPFGRSTVDGRLVFYRFNKSDPTRAAVADSVFYYRDFGLKGELKLAGKSYSSLLIDELSAGDFRGQSINPQFSGVRLMIDVNGDTRFDERREAYNPKQPFNIGGTTWELTGMTADGKFSIVKSSQTVDEIKPAPNLAPGAKALPFTAKTTAGKSVTFPADYKGKVVLLDFWATWCGPCLAELPNVLSNFAKYKASGFDILGISLDKNQDGMTSFTKEKGMTWPQIFDGKMWQTEQVLLYGVEGIPFMLIVDGDTGEIMAGSEARGEALGPAIESALARKKRLN